MDTPSLRSQKINILREEALRGGKDVTRRRQFNRKVKSANKKKKKKKFAVGDAPSNVLDPALYLKIKAEIRKEIKERRWGAYDSSTLVKRYKAAGGKYSGKKSKSSPQRQLKVA